jgi:tryptophanyl-tRNA synthetase
MSMPTDSTPVAEPKPTKDSALYDLLKLLTPAAEWGETKKKFTEGGTGYGDLKKLLLGRMLDTFSIARLRREKLANDQAYVKQILVQGRERAREVIGGVMSDCRRACGLGWQ